MNERGWAVFFLQNAKLLQKMAHQKKPVIILQAFAQVQKNYWKPAGNTGKLKACTGYWMLYFQKTAVLFCLKTV